MATVPLTEKYIQEQSNTNIASPLASRPSAEQFQMAAASLASAGGQSRRETSLQKKPKGAKIKG
jgi:hypothetical protein